MAAETLSLPIQNLDSESQKKEVDFKNEADLKRLGILPEESHLVDSKVVTGDFFEGHDWGDGWYRGGSESFYQVWRIVYKQEDTQKDTLVAIKAIHSTGGETRSKISMEAARMYVLNLMGVSPKVYAFGNGNVYKEFLVEDTEKISKVEYSAQIENIKRILDLLGISVTSGGKVESLVIQNNNQLQIIDAGNGDLSGLNLSSIAHLINQRS